MRIAFVALAAVVLAAAGCTTIQTRSGATASLPNLPVNEAYTAATKAAMSAGLTIVSTDRESGILTATRGANALLANHSPVINIVVMPEGQGSMINIGSTIGGQVIDYGTTRETVEDFCEALALSAPGATCTMQR